MSEQEYKEKIEKILEFKKELEEKLEKEYINKLIKNPNDNSIEKEEILNIIYNSEMAFKSKLDGSPIDVKDVYIAEFSGDNKRCEIYMKDATHKIAEINMEGEISFTNEMFDENVTLSEIMEESSKDDKMIELNKEEMEELEPNENEEIEEKDEEKIYDENEENELIEDTEQKTEELEEELNLDKGDIRSCVDVKLSGKDNLFRNKVKESREYDAVRLVYISSEDAFKFVGLKKGQPPKFFESIEPSKETMKTSSEIDAKDGDVEQQNIHGLMKMKESEDYDFAVKIGQYGYIELNMLRKDPVTNKYMSTKVETKTQRPQERQEEVNKMMDKNKNARITEEVKEIEEEKNEQGVNPQININDISDKGREFKEEIKKENEEEKEEENERTLDENIRKYYY